MNDLKKWASELAFCTIIAAAIALLFYLLRADRTWSDVSQTFITSFVIVFILGLWQRYKGKNKKQ